MPIQRAVEGTQSVGLAIQNTTGQARSLAASPDMHPVSLNTTVTPQSLPSVSRLAQTPDSQRVSGSRLATPYGQTLGLQPLWNLGVTGTGVGVAVIDTGIDGALPDFASSDGRHSRVVVSAVDNPKAVNGADGYGHGTGGAGIIAGLTALRFRIPTAAPRSAGATPGPRRAVG